MIITPYKNTGKTKNSNIKKFHLLNSNKEILKYSINSVYAPFGRQTDHYSQHRLNICFSLDDISNNDQSYIKLVKIIDDLEKSIDIPDKTLLSNIINRDKYGIVMRFHLKTNKNMTTTQLFNQNSEQLLWNQFDKDKSFSCNFHPDCLWIDNSSNHYGISFVIDTVYQ